MYHACDLPKLLCRLAAIVVVSVFASLPTLARVHDHLSTHDNVSSFRLSKNLERPHEKIGATALASTALLLVVRDDSQRGDVVVVSSASFAPLLASPLVSRAPPVR